MYLLYYLPTVMSTCDQHVHTHVLHKL